MIESELISVKMFLVKAILEIGEDKYWFCFQN